MRFIVKYHNRTGYCTCCGKIGVDLHHVKARGMGGNDEIDFEWNLMPLCRQHHSMVHTEGLNRFSQKQRIRDWLERNDWVFDAYIGKWIHCSE